MDAKFDPVSHRPTQIHIRDGVTVQRSGLGGRRIEETIRTRDGGVERVVHSGNWTSVQRAIPGRPGFYQRTVLVGARSYSVVYRSYVYTSVYGPVEFYRPVPAVVFAPAYYTWVISPWAQPVVYTPVAWGWTVQPWFAAYGAFFAPYPAYAAPDQQLTDYVIAANLREAYDDQHGPDAAPVAPPSGSPITVADKSAIDADLKEDLASEKQIALDPTHDEGALPEALQRREFFVHAAPLEVPTASGATCMLSEGDILRRLAVAPAKDNSVEMMVRLSQADPSHTELCAPQTHVMVQVADLQEMYNHQKEQLAEGEQIIAKQQGAAGPKPIQVASGRTDPDTAGAQAALRQVLSDADDAEKQASAVAGGL
jgi:hypothetical protein